MNDYEMHDMDYEAKLTAYALGELDGEDAAAIEGALAGDEGARGVVESVRRTARVLESELRGEPGPGLSEEQRQAIVCGEGAAASGRLNHPSVFRRRLLWAGAALAAAACVVVAVVPELGKVQQNSRPPVAVDYLGKDAVHPSADQSRPAKEVASAPSSPKTPRSAPGPGGGVVVEAEDWRRVPLEGTMEQSVQDASGGANEAPPTFHNPGAPTRGRRPPANSPRKPGHGEIVAGMSGGGGGFGAGGGERGRHAGFAGDRAYSPMPSRPTPTPPGEGYDSPTENDFVAVSEQPLSTFSIDVDTASYANVRRLIEDGHVPDAGAVRIEEMLNYFSYDYPPPTDDVPFSASVDAAPAPWNPAHRLVRVGLKGRVVDADNRPATSLVFLIDVSGSMQPANKLPLLKESMTMLVRRLTPDDRVAIVTYAGQAGLHMGSTECHDRAAIIQAIERLDAGGSTNGAGGIELAYRVASEQFIEGGVNRVILATDGDFNVGITSQDELVRLIEEKRRSGIFLSILGFGTGNFQDGRLEAISNAGNGTFSYIDGLDEARKVLVDGLAGQLVTIAKDVKIQIEFHPHHVAAYRLIGYENRMLATREFRDDRKDAGDIGAGHTVTALYEVVPAGVEGDAQPQVPPLAFQEPGRVVASDALMNVRLRYKKPDGETSTEVSFPFIDRGAALEQASGDFKFAAAVAAFGMILRDSPHRGRASFDMVADLARKGLGKGEISGALAARFLEDFATYALAGQVQLAAANLRALFEAELTDAQLAALEEELGTRQVPLRRALAHASTLAELAAVAGTLDERLASGHRALAGGASGHIAGEGSYRADFICLVERARALGAWRPG